MNDGLPTMFHVIADQGSCLIAKQHRGPNADGNAGLRLHSPEFSGGDYDAFWNGVRWVHRRERAMTFQTPELAQQYLAKNVRDM